MKKTFVRIATFLMLVCLFPVQLVQACSGFIIGKGLTTDGSILYGRTEDYPYPPNNGAHNKNYIVVPATAYAKGDMLVDESFGFTAPHLANEFKYTSTPDAARGDGSNGNFGAHGFNEKGVSMTATVTAIPNKKVLAVDPLVTAGGLGEAILIDYVLPRVTSAREGIELIAKTIDEKGSAEGNIIVIADKNEVWYMEILSGHQYVAIKFPEDKYAIFANTYYLGHVDFTDTENVIASAKVEEVAKQAENYMMVDGKFHIAKSYGPENYADGDRSRTYAGIKLLDPASSVTYEDAVYDLLRQPTDPSRRFSLQDTFALQRNRFEHLPEFRPDDEAGKVKQGDNGANDQAADATYKYALGNENVIDAHVYQINSSLPSAFGGTVWLGLAQTRNTPYVPFYGIVTDTYEAFKNRSASYDTNSWYWTVQNIDKMAISHPELFGTSIQEKWIALEKEWIASQAALDAQYAGLSEDAAVALAPTVTEATLARSAEIFAQLKAVEAEMMAKIEAATTPSSSSTEPSTSTEPSSSGTETSTSTSQSTSDSNTGGATDTSSSSRTVVPSDKKVTPTNKKGKSSLPSTGEQVSLLLVALGVAGILTAIFLHRKKSSKE
ncbi:C69 family dipeptidase [Streptococcus suis]|uniref:membrane dipeptidase n=3 Tax=Streptococcus suis TaxID=1307 RepID=A0A0H3N2T0_STRS4|nr:C69 family dipeptidase [Streptococcus suis]ABP92559.1 amylase-binding protein B [Streptococcus suis 98HAH33]ADE31688.1 amylase-binding protein B [Streptococcus suis GZ1]AER15459.1 amylase-binding protein B [Streptococcus suis SS12]AER44549.1 amylase-binding protein B [Streptococcus suis A7]AFR00677.1 dipeptidase [Streptococcus suis S735]